MEAIILAGGLGTRLKELVPDRPKPMADVGGKPFLEFLLTSLAKRGFERVILSVGYKSESIIGYFGNNFSGVELDYVIEKIPLGTGGAIVNALSHSKNDHLYVMNGDTFIEPDFTELEEIWGINRNPVMVVRELDDVSRFGAIEVSNGKASAIVEKGLHGPGFINAGCYLLPTNIFNKWSLPLRFSFESDFLRVYISKLNFLVYEYKGYFVDIGVPQDYMRANQDLLGHFLNSN